jgi:hypothetical protein
MTIMDADVAVGADTHYIAMSASWRLQRRVVYI